MGEQEAAAVAQVRIVVLELVAVITQRERLFQILGKRVEVCEVAQPGRIAQRFQRFASKIRLRKSTESL